MKRQDSLDQQARALAQPYMGSFGWPTVILGFTVTSLYFVALFSVLAGGLPLSLGALLMLLTTYLSYTVLHDAAHGSISGSYQKLRWVNEAMGYLAAWIMMIPLTAHRHEHLAHHRNTNHAEADPDLVVADMTRTPLHAIRAAVKVVTAQYIYYAKHRWEVAPRDQNVKFCLEVVAAFGLRVLILAQGFWYEGSMLFVVAGVGGVMLLMFLFAYIVHAPHQNEGRYLDTSTILPPRRGGKLITYAWGFQNYHSIHHLFPRIPFYQYQKVFGDIEQIMVSKGAPVYRMTWRGLQPQEAAIECQQEAVA